MANIEVDPRFWRFFNTGPFSVLQVVLDPSADTPNELTFSVPVDCEFVQYAYDGFFDHLQAGFSVSLKANDSFARDLFPKRIAVERGSITIELPGFSDLARLRPIVFRSKDGQRILAPEDFSFNCRGSKKKHFPIGFYASDRAFAPCHTRSTIPLSLAVRPQIPGTESHEEYFLSQGRWFRWFEHRPFAA